MKLCSNNIQKKAFLLSLSVLMGATVFFSYASSDTLAIGSVHKMAIETQEPEHIVTNSSISFVGDVMLGRHVETYLKEYGAEYVYSNLPILASTSVLVGNFEAAIPVEHTHTPDMTFSFSVDKQYIKALSEYGFNYLGLANNHSGDKGEDGLIHTQTVFEASQTTPFGNPNEVSSSSVAYTELNGLTVALIGIHAATVRPDEEDVVTTLEYASDNSDLQIVYVHWGEEYNLTHSKYQGDLAHMMVDSGADAVIGHHPHVVQDIELYKNVPIFYSLGNFIFDQYFDKDVQEGLWLTMYAENGDIQYTLDGVTSVGSPSRPRLMNVDESKELLTSLAERSSAVLRPMLLRGYVK